MSKSENQYSETMNTDEEIEQIREMDDAGELEVQDAQLSDYHQTSKSGGNRIKIKGKDLANCKPGEFHFKDFQNGTKNAYGQLKYVQKEERIRDGKAQAAAGGKYRKSTDHGGHLIGAQFGGLSIPENLFPQNSNLNQGAYLKLEKEWAKLLGGGNSVFVDISVSSASHSRQDSIYGSYVVMRPDGTSYTEYFSFANEHREEQEDWSKLL